jgi:O-antigen ligase
MNDNVRPTTWLLGSAAIVSAFVLDPLGPAPGVVSLSVLLLAALQVFISKPFDSDSSRGLIALTAAIVFIAAIEILNPNIPSIEIGLIGFRKSAAFILALTIGLGWRGSRMRALRLVWWCMFVTAVTSLLVYLLFPSIEQAVTRGADRWSAELDGAARMQGLLSGPFHISMLGVFLALSALAPSLVLPRLWLRLAAMAVGLACVSFSLVRTGFLALIFGSIVMLLAAGTARLWALRTIGFAGLVAAVAVFSTPIAEYAQRNVAIKRIFDQGLGDQRVTGRYDTWGRSIDLISRSPFVGHGSGSAGDTLGYAFAGREHVTSHNVFLKYAVEGGVIQMALLFALVTAVALAVRPARDPSRFGMAAGVTILGFSLTGSALEAIPVSVGLAVVLGLCVRTRSPRDSTHAGVEAHGYASKLRDENSRKEEEMV